MPPAPRHGTRGGVHGAEAQARKRRAQGQAAVGDSRRIVGDELRTSAPAVGLMATPLRVPGYASNAACKEGELRKSESGPDDACHRPVPIMSYETIQASGSVSAILPKRTSACAASAGTRQGSVMG